MSEFDTMLERARMMLPEMLVSLGAQSPESVSIRWPDGSQADRKRLADTLSREFGVTVKVVRRPEDLDNPAEAAAVRGAMKAREEAERQNC